MEYEITEDDANRAKYPHELFLINLIFNHVLLFIATLMATSLQFLVFIVPAVSTAIITYTLWRARRSQVIDSWFISCHWQVAAKRSRIFAAMWGLVVVAVLLILALSGGDPKPQHYAIGGLAFLPGMVTVLALVIMESEAMQQARNGVLPKWMVERRPHPEAALAESGLR